MVSITLPKYLKVFLAIMVIGFFSPTETQAQINAPDLLCVKNDTIIWDPPVSLCGAFLSYSIFISNDINGPYSILSNINDQTETEFHNPNANGNEWFYFMSTNANCPGQPTLYSDTLDSSPPVKGPTKHVSVDGNDVIIEWEPSPSPETDGYRIYRNTNAGTTLIATVGDVSTFTDTGAAPNTQTETYFVVAIDGCGQTSLFGDGSTTMLVDSTTNACTQSISLNWNLYEIWENGIDHQEIWVSIDGLPAQTVANIAGTDTTYTFAGLNNGTDYCITIKAFHANTTDVATSNELCFTANVTQPIQSLVLTNATYDDDQNILLQWFWNISAEVLDITVNKSTDNTSYSTHGSFPPPVPMIQTVTQDIGSFVDQSGTQYFQIVTTDLCDTTTVSNSASTIFTTGTPNENNTNSISWNPSEIEGATLQSYEVYSQRFNGWQLTTTATADQRSYIDPVDVTEDTEFNICYYVIGIYEITLPNGSTETIRSRSNTVCVEQFSKIFSPNAFAPYGLNNVFKPLVLFGDFVEFDMKIFNRYGERMYETTDLNEGWDGKLRGKVSSQGVYSYIITVTQPSGRQISDKGYLTLLR